MDSRWLWAILLLIIVIGGGWYVLSRPMTTEAPGATDDQAAATTTPDMTKPAESAAPAPITVTYTDQGFSPKSVSIAQGQTVTWVNNTSHNMWVASAKHPEHTGYDGTNREAHCAASYTGAKPFDECAQAAPGASYSFTFTKAGTWPYHDHVNATMFGSVVVTGEPKNAAGGSASTTTP